jgi:UDP-N-acetylmuramoyl-tripeptide--D-alanyl-D-alanine ligase
MMRCWQLSELAQPLQGLLSGADTTVAGVSIDSRSVGSQELFVALRGEKFDGHDYLERAEQAGAVAALVSDDREIKIPSLKVEDTQKALGLLGAYNRNAFEGTVVAITGSGGKTTAKNMVNAVLSQKGSTLATAGNFNNEIGVPLTLLQLAPEHEFAVIEMGAARAGDISWLVTLGRPSVAVLLNAMPAHLESFGTLEDVARAKGEIFDGLGSTDVAIINADQPWAEQWRLRAGEAQVLDFSLGGQAAVSAQAIEMQGLSGSQFIAKTPLGDIPVSLKLAGKHNVANALAAIAVGIACGLSVSEIQRGLSMAAPVAGRLATVPCANGAVLIDDCYNAQPGSVKAAIDLLAEAGGRRTLILGAMKELGPDSEALHVEVALYAKASGIEQLWGVGVELQRAVQALGEGGMYFLDRQEINDSLAGAFSTQDTVLVKGSRSAGMEMVLAAIATDEPSAGD